MTTEQPLIWPDAALEATMRADAQSVWDSIGLCPQAAATREHIWALLNRVRALEKERDDLRAIVVSLSDRVAAQSDLLTRKAER